MEMYELRYFLGVAKEENLHRASERLRVSPASLSKAVVRLEAELGVKLFAREGRHIRLTDQGRVLQRRAADIVRLEESARLEVGGHAGALQVVIAGAEILLSRMGVDLSAELLGRHPGAGFEYLATDDAGAIERVRRGEAHLGLVTSDPGKASGLAAKTIGEARFQTFVGPGHPLHAAARTKRAVAVEEVLRYPFVSPSGPLLGEVGLRQSLDGWRDDAFPRRVDFRTSSLKLLEELVAKGKALAYLPDYFGAGAGLEALKVVGCPYSCVQKVRLVARNPKDVGWLNRLF